MWCYRLPMSNGAGSESSGGEMTAEDMEEVAGGVAPHPFPTQTSAPAPKKKTSPWPSSSGNEAGDASGGTTRSTGGSVFGGTIVAGDK
jgi:hypothetical protein